MELDLDTAVELLGPPVLFALVLGGYATVVFYLCQVMSRRDIIRFQYTTLRRLTAHSFALTLLLLAWIFTFRYAVIFPLVAYLLLAALNVVVALLYNSKSPTELLIISISVLTAVRVTAYFNEDLSRDISRILPFALLGIFLANFRDFDLGATLDLLRATGKEEERIFYYWLFVVVQELVLRFVSPWVRGAGGASGRVWRKIRGM